MKNQDTQQKTKIWLYKTLIRTVFTYGCKTCKPAINIFERKILTHIYRPVEENGQWSIRYNKELYKVYKELDLVSFIKLKRLQWAGHIQQLPLDRIPKKALRATFTSNRPVGKPRKRWKGAVKENAASLLQCCNWKLTAQNKNIWRQKLWEARA
jgi:hypothetical protein